MRPLLPFALLLTALPAQNCNGTSTGRKALTDLGPGLYQGHVGGLYPDGANLPPANHMLAALQRVNRIVPRDALGAPSPAGRIVLLSIGMSNATQEYSAFVQLANADPRKQPSVLLVDGAQGGQTAAIIVNPNANFWTVVTQRLTALNATPAQVAAVWLKEANAGPTQPFPAEALTLQGQLEGIAQILKGKYPNLELCFLASRTYAGYATTTLNPEPHAYETGFACQWLIRDQIQGKPALNPDPARGPVLAPLLLWGPYLWADGLLPRGDGLTWLCSDFGTDGTHPSTQGRQKVGRLLLDFFTRDPVAAPWFCTGRGTSCQRAELTAYGAGTTGSRGVPGLAALALPILGGAQALVPRVTDARPGAACALLLGTQPASMPFLGGTVLVQPTVSLATTTDALGQGTWDLGLLPLQPAWCGVHLFGQALVIDPAGPAGVIAHSRGLDLRLGE